MIGDELITDIELCESIDTLECVRVTDETDEHGNPISRYALVYDKPALAKLEFWKKKLAEVEAIFALIPSPTARDKVKVSNVRAFVRRMEDRFRNGEQGYQAEKHRFHVIKNFMKAARRRRKEQLEQAEHAIEVASLSRHMQARPEPKALPAPIEPAVVDADIVETPKAIEPAEPAANAKELRRLWALRP